MIEMLTRTRPLPLTKEDVEAWARLALFDDRLWHWLRRHSPHQDARDAEAMFAATDAAGEPAT
jgi:hypothetical protein